MTRPFGISLCLVLGVAGCGGCGKKDKPADPQAGDSGAPATSAGVAGKGPTVTIPAGAVKAGMPCGGFPRVTNEELVGDSIQLNEFTIDVLPYPNDPSKPVRVDVSRDEAAGLCAADGKRLCTELEWERACKGPSNTTFEYGPSYNAVNCKIAPDLMPDKRAKCVSGFGVKDMHGLAWEWTGSAWGRGSSGELMTIRGGYGSGGTLQARCANGQGKPSATKQKDVGFRCCSGPMNTAAVELTLQKQPPMVEEPSVEANLAATMLKAMPPDHRTVKDADVGFDKVWRWHPRDNEELLVGRWTGKPKGDKPPFSELAIFKVCSAQPMLIGRMRGPVATLGKPGAGADAQKASVPVEIGEDKGDVKLTYSYGSVLIDQPPWIKAGNSLEAADTKDAGAKRPTIKLRPPPKK